MQGQIESRWLHLYHTALLELEHAKMAGRIEDARAEIASRLEELCEMPGLHHAERQALSDALHGLWALEREDVQHEENERRIAEWALERLRMIEPKMRAMKTRV